MKIGKLIVAFEITPKYIYFSKITSFVSERYNTRFIEFSFLYFHFVVEYKLGGVR